MMVYDTCCCDRWHTPLFCDYYNPSPDYIKGFEYLPKQLRATAPVDFTWQGLTDAAAIIHIYDYYGNKPVTELYFAIATVAKGNRYSDICVSEIVFLGE